MTPTQKIQNGIDILRGDIAWLNNHIARLRVGSLDRDSAERILSVKEELLESERAAYVRALKGERMLDALLG